MSQCYSTWTIPKIVHDAFTGNMSDTNTGTVHFDSDSKYIVLDNSANCHICKDKSMFVTEIKPLAATSNLQVQTAGGNYAPQGIGSVRWKWRDDDGKLHNELIEEGLYFPESPVNILGITKWAKQRQEFTSRQRQTTLFLFGTLRRACAPLTILRVDFLNYTSMKVLQNAKHSTQLLYLCFRRRRHREHVLFHPNWSSRRNLLLKVVKRMVNSFKLETTFNRYQTTCQRT